MLKFAYALLAVEVVLIMLALFNDWTLVGILATAALTVNASHVRGLWRARAQAAKVNL